MQQPRSALQLTKHMWLSREWGSLCRSCIYRMKSKKGVSRTPTSNLVVGDGGWGLLECIFTGPGPRDSDLVRSCVPMGF